MTASSTVTAKATEMTVTVKIRMTGGQAADYANEYGFATPALAIADIQGSLRNTVTCALQEPYVLREFTSVTVSGPR